MSSRIKNYSSIDKIELHGIEQMLIIHSVPCTCINYATFTCTVMYLGRLTGHNYCAMCITCHMQCTVLLTQQVDLGLCILITVPPTCFADFQYKYSHFSVFCMIFHFQYLANSSIYNVCTKLPNFQYFPDFYQ